MVATPYTTADLKARLAEVAGDVKFADDFFARYIQGHDVVDYAKLLSRAGLVMRKRAAGEAFFTGMQALNFSVGQGARVSAQVPFDSSLYKAGVEHDDTVVAIDGVNLSSPDALNQALRKRKPRDQVAIRFVRRSGEPVDGTLVLEEDPRIEIVPIEQSGGTLTDEQRRFRSAWLDTRMSNP
jgi:predicted metalloprotease with PDZ domain